MFSSWHLPKVLIRESAIRACSGASTLKGSVPWAGARRRGEKKKRAGVRHIKKTPFFGSAAGEVQESQKKSAIVLIFRTAQNLSAEGERHGTSHQLQQPIRRQRDAPPHGFIHTPPPQPRTKTSRKTRKRPPVSSVPISISGLVVEYIVTIVVTRVRFPADAIFPILHLCTRTLGKKQNLDRRTLNSKP